jgi:hypothetical protein
MAKARLFTNHRVDADLFHPGFLDAAEARTLRVVHSVAAGEPSLAVGTEAVYHEVRVRGWVSAEYGVSSLARLVLAPFFHPHYIAWGRRCRPQDKQGASIFSEVLSELDPDLAEVPVNGGLSPVDLARRDVAMRARRSARGLDRTWRKVRQRIGAAEKPPVSATTVADGVLHTWRCDPAALDPLATIGVFDQRFLDELSSGRRAPTSATVAFLANVSSALELASAVPDG